jgi:hypothetical protein
MSLGAIKSIHDAVADQIWAQDHYVLGGRWSLATSLSAIASSA